MTFHLAHGRDVGQLVHDLTGKHIFENVAHLKSSKVTPRERSGGTQNGHYPQVGAQLLGELVYSLFDATLVGVGVAWFALGEEQEDALVGRLHLLRIAGFVERLQRVLQRPAQVPIRVGVLRRRRRRRRR